MPSTESFTYSAPSDLTYDGNAKTATVVGASGMGQVTVKYFSDPECNDELVGSPTDVGAYYVGITAEEGTSYSAVSTVLHDASWKFMISKQDAPVSLNADQKPTANTGMTYTGNEQELVTAPTNAPTGYTVQYSLDGTNWSTELPNGTNAGDYTVKVKYVGDNNHEDFNGMDIAVTIGKGTISTLTDDQKPTAKIGLTYAGNEQELVTAPTELPVGYKEMQYALGTKDAATEEYTTSIPTATDAGTYYVWYKAIGDESHSDSEAKVITVTIQKKGEAHTHTFKLVDAKEPTCTEDGYKEHYECSECGAWFGDSTGVYEITDKSGYIIGAIGHKWGAYEVTKRPTYDEEGLKVYTCENDPSHTKEETIPRLSSSSSSSSDNDSDSDSDSDSSGSRSSSGSSSKNSASQAMVDEINNVTSGNVPENHQAESGVAASDVGGKWANEPNADTWTYTKSDGTLAKSEWMSLDYNGLRYWYYFNDDGNMQTNWFDYNNERFYLMPEKDGWRGRMATGWKNIENKWYYFETVPGSSQGRLYRSTVTPDGHTVGADGAWNGVGETPVGQK